jgi:hypothetical protein
VVALEGGQLGGAQGLLQVLGNGEKGVAGARAQFTLGEAVGAARVGQLCFVEAHLALKIHIHQERGIRRLMEVEAGSAGKPATSTRKEPSSI